MSYPQDGAETERPAPAPTGVGETEVRCRSLFDLLPAGVLVLDPAGTILYSNAAAQEIFGRSIAQLEGRSLLDPAFTPVHVDGTPIPPDERPLERAVQGGEPVHDVSLVVSRPDGARVWLLVSAYPLRDATGAVTQVVLTLLDVTARQEAEEALRRSESRFRTLFEAAPIGIAKLDAQYRYAAVNDALSALSGYTREELIGMDAVRLHPAEQREALLAEIHRRVTQDVREPAEYTLLTKDGEPRTALVNGVTVVGREGQRVRLTFIMDITAFREAAEALLASERRQAAILNALPDLVVRLSRAGEYLDVYTGASHPLLTPGQTLIGRSVREVLPPEVAEATLSCIARALETGSMQVFEYALPLPRGAHHIEARYVVSGADEVVAISRDITARVQAEDALRQANADLERASQAKSAFLAMMSHEIRTPLNGVIGLTSLLLHTPLSHRQREYADGIQASGDALLSLIDDILDFSKIEAGQLTLEARPLDLRQLVGEVVGLFTAEAQAKGLRLHAQVDPAVPPALLGDRVRLRQVLLNLVGNALKFTERGAVGIEVGLAEESAQDALVRVEVRDTGIGIAPEVQDALFKPFVQADASTTRRYGGTGLGLAIARCLVEAMGGQIGVQSTPGVGSTFWLTLRLARVGAAGDAQPDPMPLRPDGLEPAGQRRRVLVAEDNAINRLVIVGLLESLGCVVQTVENGQQAVEAVRAEHYDLVLMDVHMPELDGFAATAAIRERERMEGGGRHLPIVALTADALVGDAEKSLAAGMDGHLSKPITREGLAAVLERWLPPRAAPE